MKKTIVAVCLLISTGAVQASELVRGPYIQYLEKDSALIRWKTKNPDITMLNYSDDQNTYHYQDRLLNTEHLVRLTNLKPDTKYEYIIATEARPGFMDKLFKREAKAHIEELLPSANCFFITQAPANVNYQSHIWVLGDPGTTASDIFAKKYKLTQLKVRDAYYKYREANKARTDLILTLGDNVYDRGTEQAYNKGFFAIYDTELVHTPIYTVFGNHDAGLNRKQGTFEARSYPYPNGAYYDIFTSPEKRSAYYSFNYQGIHFIVLDSHDSFWEDYDGSNYERVWVPGSPAKNKMLEWLKQDLEGNHSDWTIVAFHHPPFGMASEGHELRIWQQWIRVAVVPILEKYKVDLVLSGHVHNYQRTYPLMTYQSESQIKLAESIKKKGPYHPSFLNEEIQQLSMAVSNKTMSDSKTKYTKGQGIIYVILGSSGAAFQEVKEDIATVPSLITAMQKEGSLILDINAQKLNAKFLSSEGEILDEFSVSN